MSKRVRTCEYVKPNGHFCGSVALRGRDYCHFHLTYIGRRLRIEQQQAKMAPPPLELPPLEDANSVQIALMQVLTAAANGHISPKLVGLMLYGLQIASTNLRLGVNFKAQSTDLNQGPEVCSAYDSFEEDYEIAGHAELKRSAADRQAEEQERANAQAAAREAIEKRVPDSVEEQHDDLLLRFVLRQAAEAADPRERNHLIAKCYYFTGYSDVDNEFGRPAGRQKVLFAAAPPPAAAPEERKAPQAVEQLPAASSQ